MRFQLLQRHCVLLGSLRTKTKTSKTLNILEKTKPNIASKQKAIVRQSFCWIRPAHNKKNTTLKEANVTEHTTSHNPQTLCKELVGTLFAFSLVIYVFCLVSFLFAQELTTLISPVGRTPKARLAPSRISCNAAMAACKRRWRVALARFSRGNFEGGADLAMPGDGVLDGMRWGNIGV